MANTYLNERKTEMTQQAARSFPAGRIILLVAAVLAALSVGFAISRGQGPELERGATPAAGSSIADLEQATVDKPEDAKAWQALGLAYFSESKFEEAAVAYEKAVAIDSSQAILWSALGEARVMASERDPMPDKAVEAFEKAIAIDPNDPRARYFLAVQKDLGGNHAGAISDWLALLEDTPTDAPWRNDLIRTIEQVGKINDIDVADRLAAAGAQSPQVPTAARPIPGPTRQDLAAASSIPPGEQREMAEGMVSRLEERLKGEPANVDGWVMLMRSRMTLEQPAKARKALDDAIAANPAKADYLKEQAAMLGIR